MLHDLAGKRSEVLSVDPASSAMDLIQRIVLKNGKRFQDFIYDDSGQLRSGLAFAVNGVSVEKAALKRAKCRDIAEFVILPPISGG